MNISFSYLAKVARQQVSSKLVNQRGGGKFKKSKYIEGVDQMYNKAFKGQGIKNRPRLDVNTLWKTS